MIEMSFSDWRNAVLQYAQQEKYQESLDLMAHPPTELTPAQRHEMKLFASFAHCELGQLEQAVAALKTIASEDGFIPLGRLKTAPSLAPLQEREDFQALLSEFQHKHDVLAAAHSPSLHTEHRPDAHKHLLLLHWNQGNAAQCTELFNDLPYVYGIHAAESGQFQSPQAFHWNDQEKAQVEITRWQTEIAHPLTLVGFSLGAATALNVALKTRHPVKGVLAIIPFIPDTIEIPAQEQVFPVVLIIGRKDPHGEQAEQLAENLRQHGFPVKIAYQSGGHLLPQQWQEDWAQLRNEALEWLDEQA